MPEKRSFYEKLARERGYDTADSVTGSLSLLVAADPAENSSKLVKARKLSVKILALEEFLQSSAVLPEAAAAEEQPDLFAAPPAAPASEVQPVPEAPGMEEEQPELF
jgi:hypothetical protein